MPILATVRLYIRWRSGSGIDGFEHCKCAFANANAAIKASIECQKPRWPGSHPCIVTLGRGYAPSTVVPEHHRHWPERGGIPIAAETGGDRSQRKRLSLQ